MIETETAEAQANGKAPGGKHKSYVIFIDREQFKVESDVMTGTKLRALPMPPIGQDRDLWEEIPGHGDDRKINDTDVVTLKEGTHFFTTPRAVTPGAPDAA
jgi:hypothetical protein